MDLREYYRISHAYVDAVIDRLEGYDPGPLHQWFFFAVAMAIFIAPGYWWASWLHRRSDEDDPANRWWFRVLLGFAWSFAIFAPVAWPFLWLGGSSRAFLLVIGGVWAAFCLGSAYLYFVHGGVNAGASGVVTRKLALPSPPPVCSRRDGFRTLLTCLTAMALMVGYCGAMFLLLHDAWSLRGRQVPFDNPAWRKLGLLLTIWLFAGIGLAVLGRLLLRRALEFHNDDDRPASRVAVSLAVAFVAVQTFTAMFFDRPDWDDCFYLAAVLDYQETDSFNSEEPSHREGFPMPAFDRLLAWELWGAVLCRLTGLNPMAVFHTLLQALLVPFAYLAYARLLGECIPRRWVALAILGVAAYHLWGVASHNTPANFLLNRTGQGKAVLLHLGLPLIAAAQIRFFRQPGWANGLTLAACSVFGLAASSSGVFLIPMLVSCLGIALAPTLLGPILRRWLGLGTKPAPGIRHLLVCAAGCVAAVAPSLAYGLLIRSEVLADKAVVFDWEPESDRVAEVWAHEVGDHMAYGLWEPAWFLLLPMIGLLAWNYHRVAYLAAFPAVLLLTFANPYAYPWVAQTLTSYWTYFRIFWLFPVAAGLGVFLALFARLAGRMLWVGWQLLEPESSRQGQLPSRWKSRLADGVACLAATVGVLASLKLPGLYVWGERNVRQIQAHREVRNPPVVDNVLKMPGDLVPLAEFLRRQPDIQSYRILAIEQASNFLTPYARNFRFVQTRELYTFGMAVAAGRREEGEKRYLLAWLLEPRRRVDDGHDRYFWFQDQGDVPYQVWHRYYISSGPIPRDPLPLTRAQMIAWCDELRVKYAITFSDSGSMGENLRQVGFQPTDYREFTLWTRSLGGSD